MTFDEVQKYHENYVSNGSIRHYNWVNDLTRISILGNVKINIGKKIFFLVLIIFFYINWYIMIFLAIFYIYQLELYVYHYKKIMK